MSRPHSINSTIRYHASALTPEGKIGILLVEPRFPSTPEELADAGTCPTCREMAFTNDRRSGLERRAELRMGPQRRDSCGCYKTETGIIYCEKHVPPVEPCVLCHRLGDETKLVVGANGVRWHIRCAEDNS